MKNKTKATIIIIGNINPDASRLNIPNMNPNISPLVVNQAVFMFKYPKIMKSKKPSIAIDKNGLNDKF